MKRVKLNNDHNSGGMSTNEPPRSHRKSERDFLTDQAADAQVAISRTLDDMGDTLHRIVDVRSLAKRHPWLVVGSAVAAGFIASAVLTSALRKSPKATGMTIRPDPQPRSNGQDTSRAKRPSFLPSAVSVVAGIVHTVVINSLISAVAAAQERHRAATSSSQDSTAAVERKG